MAKTHEYQVRVEWTGNDGTGTSTYGGYRREHTILIEGKPEILGSADPMFRGDPTRHNPEEMLVAALSTCHMLTFLHRCVVAGVSVEKYTDSAVGTMELTAEGGGRFTSVTLRPQVEFSESPDSELVRRLHDEAHHLCFIANSVNFPVICS